MLLLLEKGQKIKREDITRRLVEILYERNDVDFRRGTFRVRGDIIEVFPTYDDKAYRIELFGDEIESLSQIDPALRHGQAEVLAPADLSQDPLRRPARAQERGHRLHPRRARSSGKRSSKRKAAWSSAARPSAHPLRSRDDQVHGLLPRHRELLAPFLRPPARRAAAHAARLFPARLSALRRREPRDRSAGARHVARRPLAASRTSSTTASACPPRWTTAR